MKKEIYLIKPLLNKLEKFQPTPTLAYFLITLATFLWALSIVTIRGVHEEIPPLGLSSLRWFLGVIFLLPFVWGELFRKHRLIKRHFGWLCLMGVLQVGSSTMLVVGVNFTTAINAAVINAAQPATTAIAVWIVMRDKITLGQGIGIITGLIGIMVIVGRADFATLLRFDVNTGDWFVVLAIIGWGFYASMMHRMPRELGMTTFLFLTLATGSFASLPFYIWESLNVKTVPFTFESVIAIIYLGIIVSVFSIYLWNAGIRSIGANKASIFLNLIPVFGAMLAIFFLGEYLLSFHFIGGALICLGITLVIKLGRNSPEIH